MTPWRLVADIGGTNVRLARSDTSGRLDQVTSHSNSHFASFQDVLHHYLKATGGIAGCSQAALGAAGPVDGDTVTLTNHTAWTITRAEVCASLAGAPVALVNDLQAVAAALPHLDIGDLEPIGTPRPQQQARQTMLALNVGTGLGASIALHCAGRWWTLAGEAGHMTLGRITDLERDLFEADATVEDLLSGAGIVRAYARLSGNASEINAAQVLARTAHDRVAAHLVHAMTDVLGRVAGDLVLATGAWGGAHLCGSVADGLLTHADRAHLRAAFESKGPMQERMRRTPLSLIRRENVALFGLAMMPIET